MIRDLETGQFRPVDFVGNQVIVLFELWEGFIEKSLDFRKDDDILLHLKFIEITNTLLAGNFFGKWGEERHFEINNAKNRRNCLSLKLHENIITLDLNGICLGEIEDVADIRNADTIDNKLDSTLFISNNGAIRSAWRQCTRPSGKAAPSPVLQSVYELEPGLTAIVRAKNEEKTITECLAGVSPLVDSIVCVDNGSADSTLTKMKKVQQNHFNTKVFSYNCDVPRVGSGHTKAYYSDSPNTLGRYYNFCLSKCHTKNFMKWDADFLPITRNLSEMIRKYDLRTRSDNFSLWFTGVSVWTDGDDYWIDEEARYNEFRAHSKEHNAQWVDLPPWEEMDQTYLYKAHLYAFDKPVFIELFNIDHSEFEERGVNILDIRDRDRQHALVQHKNTGTLPDRFKKIQSLYSEELQMRKVSDIDQQNMQYMLKKYNSVPTISINETVLEVSTDELPPQYTLGIFCISHAKNKDRIDAIRESFKKDFDFLGIPFYFVVGRPGQPEQILGDIVYLDCSDKYEALAKKIATLNAFVIEKFSFDYIAKIDDDTWVNAYSFCQLPYYENDYSGGRIAGGREMSFDWHKGKCSNSQLDDVLVTNKHINIWYGGGYSYFLSNKASMTIAQNAKTMESFLYEDIGVATVLREILGIEVDQSNTYAAINYSEVTEDFKGLRDIPIVTDIPTIDELWNVHNLMGSHLTAHQQIHGVSIDTDWFLMDESRNVDNVLTLKPTDSATDEISSATRLKKVELN